MSEGEALDVNSNETDFSENDYFECISKKTASLFAASACMGCRIGGAPAQSISRCTEFGMHLGMAYQIIDDILECKELQHEKKSENTSTTLPHILKHDAIGLSIKAVQHHVDCSKQIINSFDETEVRTKLQKIVDYMTSDLAGAVD